MNLSLIGEQIAGLDSFLINQKADLAERRTAVVAQKTSLIENIQNDRMEFQKAIDDRRAALVAYINGQFKELGEWIDQELKRNEEMVAAAFDGVIASIDHQIKTVQATRGEDEQKLAA